MRRRDFITLAVGAAATWPLTARAQKSEQMRRVGVLMNLAANDPQGAEQIGAFVRRLKELGWSIGDNLQIVYRWAEADAALYHKYATELVALAPDVILAPNTSAVRAVLEATHSTPIVFTQVTDPVSGGLVASLARPGGNVTGFIQRDFGLAAKSLELLKQLSPRSLRVAVLRDATTTGGAGQLGAMQAAAPSFGIDLTPIDLRDAAQIERDVATFSRQPDGIIFVTTSARAALHRSLIIALASRYKLPAMYPFRYWVNDGGLLSYGPNPTERWLRAAEYVDRILKGEAPADLPVQEPTKYELVINLKTAKALGLNVPQPLLATADEVIE
jgi:putative ABC transport system substrate-binding protein